MANQKQSYNQDTDASRAAASAAEKISAAKDKAASEEENTPRITYKPVHPEGAHEPVKNPRIVHRRHA